VTRCRWLLCALLTSGCVTLTPEGARVSVYNAPVNAPPEKRTLPGGCRLVDSKPPYSTTELEIEGQRDPFRVARNEAGAAGANVLLVVKDMIVSRHDLECPGSSPITDCPPSSGAWYRVMLESYTCTPDALQALSPSNAVTTSP